jgi:hypothetical protein
VFSGYFKKIDKIKDNREMREFVPPIQEGLNSVLWVLTNQPKATLDSAIESSEYHAIKIKRLKKPAVT